jgi:hypothetical protein
MFSKKAFLIALSLILVLFLGTGCDFNKFQSDQTSETSPGEEEWPADENRLPNPDDNFLEADLADLSVGEQVTVLGSENDDGSLWVSRIIIGGAEINFDFGVPTSPSGSKEQLKFSDNQENFDPPAEGSRPNFEGFQDMSDEERQQMREEMMAQGASRGGLRTNGAVSDMVRLSGEILDFNDASLVLKLPEGGSKIIFISNSTVILKAKEFNAADSSATTE